MFTGWTSPDGREFGAIGQSDGTAFVEVASDGQIKYLGRLPTQTENSIWRDLKVINGYVYIGSEASGHGLQVFDMRKVYKPEKSRHICSKLYILTRVLVAVCRR